MRSAELRARMLAMIAHFNDASYHDLRWLAIRLMHDVPGALEMMEKEFGPGGSLEKYDTTISGYHAPPYDPPQPVCPHCHQESHECRCLPGLPDYGYDDDLQERISSGELDELALQQVYRDFHALQPGFWELTARAVTR